jgi:hypothetical protein
VFVGRLAGRDGLLISAGDTLGEGRPVPLEVSI